MDELERLLLDVRTEEVRRAIRHAYISCRRVARVGFYLSCVFTLLMIFSFSIFSGIFEKNAPMDAVSITAPVVTEETSVPPPFVAESRTPEQTPAATPAVVKQEIHTTVVSGTLVLGSYDPLYEYLEYGESVEFFQPGQIRLSWMEDDSWYNREFLLIPPHFRALKKALGDIYVSGLEVTFRDQELLLVWGEDGVVWDASQTTLPRPLNELEQWYLDYITFQGWDFEMEEVFDTLPTCEEHCSVSRWSPAEQEARSMAFLNHVQNPDNNVWVEIWRAVDATYRWVDAESGAVLPRVSAGGWHSLLEQPASGWLELQIEGGDAGWVSRARFKTSYGFSACINQIGDICGAGELAWSFYNQAWNAQQTEEVLKEDLLKELSSFYGEALDYEREASAGYGEILAVVGDPASFSLYRIEGEVTTAEEIADAINASAVSTTGQELYVAWYDLHFFDPENEQVARWLDSRSEFTGWRDAAVLRLQK